MKFLVLAALIFAGAYWLVIVSNEGVVPQSETDDPAIVAAVTQSDTDDPAIVSAIDDLASICLASGGDKAKAEEAIIALDGYEFTGPNSATDASGRIIILLAGSGDNFSCVFAYDPNVDAPDDSISANVARTLAALDVVKSELAARLDISENDFVEEQGTLTYTSEAIQVLILPRSSIRIAINHQN
ncbi:hypothetical protein [Yoonia sp. BS5-3]|uniref:Lipoprotein n=1 Tax=Yoonia phaeophyticola TaxID=3137369 RepID=A0ABZ2V327_9RHOB